MRPNGIVYLSECTRDHTKGVCVNGDLSDTLRAFRLGRIGAGL